MPYLTAAVELARRQTRAAGQAGPVAQYFTRRAEVGPGSVALVPAGERHEYVDITDDLTSIVIVAPPQPLARAGRRRGRVRGQAAD
jgi:hypothetical protein